MTKSLYLHFLIVVSAGKLKNFVGYADRRPAVVGGPRKVQRARKKAALSCPHLQNFKILSA